MVTRSATFLFHRLVFYIPALSFSRKSCAKGGHFVANSIRNLGGAEKDAVSGSAQGAPMLKASHQRSRSAHCGMKPCLSKDNHFEVSSEKSIPSSRGHCTSWCIFNPKQLRDGVIPLITVPGELRSQSHSSWHFTSCPPLCLCSQLAAGSKFGHMQDKFLQGCEWSAQKLPQIVMRAARFTQVFCHQRTQKSFSRSSSFRRNSHVCANVSFSLGTPEIGGDLHSDPASLGTTNTGTVRDLDGSPLPHCLAHPRDPYSRAETAWSTLEVFATQGKRGRA